MSSIVEAGPGQASFCYQEADYNKAKVYPKCKHEAKVRKGDFCLLNLRPLLRHSSHVLDATLNCSCSVYFTHSVHVYPWNITEDFILHGYGWQMEEGRERSLSIYCIPGSILVLHVIIPLIILKVINDGEKVSAQGSRYDFHCLPLNHATSLKR